MGGASSADRSRKGHGSGSKGGAAAHGGFPSISGFGLPPTSLFGFRDFKSLPHLEEFKFEQPLYPLGHGAGEAKVFRGVRSDAGASRSGTPKAGRRSGSSASKAGKNGTLQSQPHPKPKRGARASSAGPPSGGRAESPRAHSRSGGAGDGGDVSGSDAESSADAGRGRAESPRPSPPVRAHSQLAERAMRKSSSQNFSLRLSDFVALKCQPVHVETSGRLLTEQLFYESLEGGGAGDQDAPKHWPALLESGLKYGYRVLALELLGPTLDDVLHLCNPDRSVRDMVFTLETVCLIAVELIEAVRCIHARGWVHGDVRPKNILMGSDPQDRTLYFVGFGNGIRFREEGGSGKHIPRGVSPLQPHILSSPYAPLAAYKGYTLSRKDDLESIGYVLIRLLRGSLPWFDLQGGIDMPSLTTAKGALAKQKKLNTTDDDLCKGLPPHFVSYLDYVRMLGFHEPPDYGKVSEFFENCLKEVLGVQGGSASVTPDWVAMRGSARRGSRARREKSLLS